jgi:hypothetical protein
MRFIKKILWFLFYSFYCRLFIFRYFCIWFILILRHFIFSWDFNFYIIFFDTDVIWMTCSRFTVRSIISIGLSLSLWLIFRWVFLFWYWTIMVICLLESSNLFCVWRNVRLFFIRFWKYKIWYVMVSCFRFFWFYFWLIFKLIFK